MGTLCKMYIRSKISTLCAYRFGNCVPFEAPERGTPCDILYTPGVDYIYVSYRRKGGDFDEYLDIFEDFAGLLFNIIPEKCRSPTIHVLCHYFLPPCGNFTTYVPPKSICSDACNYLQETCPSAWEQVIAYFEDNDFWLRP